MGLMIKGEWVKLTAFNAPLKRGMKVRSCLSGYSITGEWYEGNIHYIHNQLSIDIERKDGREGTGEDCTWSVLLGSDNKQYLEIWRKIQEWDT